MQQQHALLLWLCLPLLLHLQLTPGSCQGHDSTGPSWEAARAAARAAFERNLQLAGLVEGTGVGAEYTAHVWRSEAAAPVAQHATKLAAGTGVNTASSSSSRVDEGLLPTPGDAAAPAVAAGAATAVIAADAAVRCPASTPGCQAGAAAWASDRARAAAAAAANVARSAAVTTAGAARSAAATAADVARSAAAATPGVARSAAATAADAARSMAAATPGIAWSAAAAAATTAHLARSAATAAAGAARSAAAAAAAVAAGKAAQPAAAAAAAAAVEAVEVEASLLLLLDAMRTSQPADVAHRPGRKANEPQQLQLQQQQQQQGVKDNQQGKQEQQQTVQPSLYAWLFLWFVTHLSCLLLGWLLRGKCAQQQPLAAAAAAGGLSAADAAAEGSGDSGSRSLQVAAAGGADKTVPAKANRQQQHQHARCSTAVDAPAGEQEQQQQDPAPTAGPAVSATAPAAAGEEGEEGAASSGATSLSSNDELSAAAAATTPAAAEAHHSAPISKAAGQKKRLGRRAGVPHVLHLASKHHSAARPRDQAGRAAASSLDELQQQQEQQFGTCQLHSRGSSKGGRSSAGGARSSSSSSGGGVVKLMQLQAVQAPAAALLVQSGGQQQQMQVTFTAGPEVVQGVLIPAVRVLQQLAVGVSSLSVLSTAVVHQLHSVTHAGSRLASQLDQLLGWAGKQERQSKLAAQQALGERAGQLGLGLLLAGLAVAAVRVGRLWEVHQVCMARNRPGGWQVRVTGMAGLSNVWQYASCCSQQLGLFAVGLLVLYWLARASWQGLLSSSSGSSGSKGAAGTPSRAWQLDLLLFRGVVCSLVGAHVVHCLGAAWLPWLLLWLVWVGCQIAVQVVQLRLLSSLLAVLCVGLLLPLAMAAAPFHAKGLLLQGWVLEVSPCVGQLLVLQRVLPL